MNIDKLVDDICKNHQHNNVERVNNKVSFFKFLNKHPFYIGNLIGCMLVLCVCGYSFLLILSFIVLAIIYTLNIVLKNK